MLPILHGTAENRALPAPWPLVYLSMAAHMVSSDVSHFHEFSSRMRLGDASWRSSQTKGDTTMKAPLGLMLAMIGGVVIGATAINHPNAQSSAGFEKRNLVTTNGQKASSQKW